MAFEDPERRIDPGAFYSERDLILRWGISHVAQANERQAGRLKAIRWDGSDLLAWFNAKH